MAEASYAKFQLLHTINNKEVFRHFSCYLMAMRAKRKKKRKEKKVLPFIPHIATAPRAKKKQLFARQVPAQQKNLHEISLYSSIFNNNLKS